MARCRSCQAAVIWAETASGRRAPFDAPEGTVNHFVTCPQRREWKKQPEPQGLLFDADDPTLAARPEGKRYPR